VGSIDPRDARAAFAAITPRGQSVVRKARDNHHEFLRQTFAAALDDTDLADLARIMDRISMSIPSAGMLPQDGRGEPLCRPWQRA
jgi:DNA-binding MarR family transcriptional regulator